MQNTHPDAVTIDLGGKERYIKLGPSAFRRAELRGSTVNIGTMEAPSLSDLTHLVWVGLLPDEPTLDEDTVLEWLADGDEYAAMGAVRAALERMAEAMAGVFDGESGGVSKKKQTQKRRS